MRPLLGMLCLLCTLLGGAVLAAQPEVTVHAAARRLVMAGDVLLADSPEQIRSGHTWALVPVTSASAGGAADLLHMPPFDASKRVTSGSVRNVLPLQRPVMAGAAWDGSVYLVMSDGAGSGGGGAAIGRFTARKWLRDGAWEYAPSARLEIVGSLPEEITLRSIEQTKYGLAALWERRSGGVGSLELAILDDLGWRMVDLPAWLNAEPANTDAHLLPDATRVLLAIRPIGDDELRVWGAVVDRRMEQPVRSVGAKHAPGPLVTLSASWERAPVATVSLPEWCVGEQIRTVGPSAPDWLLRVDGQFVLARREKDMLSLWRLTSGKAFPLAKVGKLSVDTGVTGVSGAGRVRVLTTEPTPQPSTLPGGGGGGVSLLQPSGDQRPPLDPGAVRIVDISLSTGEALFDGPAQTGGLFSKREFGVLWLVFLGIGAVMLLFVMRAEPALPVVLPPGMALATPGKRSLAALIDAVVAIVIAAVICGQSPAQFLVPSAEAPNLAPLLVSMLAAGLHCALGEGYFGRSIGKAIVGISVAAMRRETEGPAKGTWVPARTTIWQAMIRNVVRWWMPPLGIVMYFDDNWRHPGDQLAHTVVVCPIEEEGETDGSGDDQEPE